MYHRHSPKGWDRWSRFTSNSVEFLRKDATFVPEVRSPTGRRRELGALLRRLRTEEGLTVEQAAKRLMFSMSKLSRMETGHGVATPRDIRDSCEMQIEARLTRQRILTRDHPPRFAVVLDEAALRRLVRGRRGAHPAVESNFTIVELPNPTPGVVFVEGLIGLPTLSETTISKGIRKFQ